MTLPTLFERSLVRRAGENALECAGHRYTFRDLERRANGLARVLTARGIRSGDRLGISLTNRVEFIDVFLACVKLGVMLVPINILYQEREVAHILTDAGPKAVVSDGTAPAGVACWDPAELAAAAADGPADPIDASITSESPAAIIYTSGTTGTPKGAVLTQGNLRTNAESLLDAWQITHDDRLLLALPLFHVHGLGNGLCSWLAAGGPLRLLERFDHREAAGEFLAFRPTLFFGVPTIYVRLLEIPEERAVEIGGFVRLFVSGSAPLPVHVFEAFERRFGHRILERYGMTETLMNTSNPLAGERRPGTVGLPLPGVSIRIATPDGAEAAPEQTGEVLVKGANVFAGYWNRPDATRDAFADGWFKTGDIGVRSPDGYITLCGRLHDLIISGGFNIYPREIEDVLLEIPGVREAVVIGAPDEIRGEVPVAYVVVADGLDVGALGALIRTQVASFKVPRAFVRVNSLPRTALGKIQRHLLPPWTR